MYISLENLLAEMSLCVTNYHGRFTPVQNLALMCILVFNGY